MSTDELHALRERVERLEGIVAQLTEKKSPTPSAPPPLPVTRTETKTPPVAATSTTPPPIANTSPDMLDRVARTPSTVWIAGAGALFLLIGAIYALIVSVQRGWISPPVRVAGGLLLAIAIGWYATKRLLRGGENRGAPIALLSVALGVWSFALYYGSHEIYLFPALYGLAGTVVATIFAGALAARIRSSSTLAIATTLAAFAPVIFSNRSGSLAGLLLYLSAVVGAQIAVQYLSGEGARWAFARIAGICVIWLVALIGTASMIFGNSSGISTGWNALYATQLLALATLVATWLPRHPQLPKAPGTFTICTLLSATIVSVAAFDKTHMATEFFAILLFAYASLCVALVPFARKRMGWLKHDLPLLLLAAAFSLVAVPVALDDYWTPIAFGAFAAVAAFGARFALRTERPEATGVKIAAFLACGCATVTWLIAREFSIVTPFVNHAFISAALTSVGWFFLIGTGGIVRALAFSALQLVAVNAIAFELQRTFPRTDGPTGTLLIGAVLATLTYATAGAVQWFRGVTVEPASAISRTLRIAGYGWLVVASIKLLGYDLEQMDTFFRAIAALGVGAVFIGAALWASRKVAAQKSSQQ